ncbi:hypothetical protein HK097_010170, partial [Rhizophlyctis rosea]
KANVFALDLAEAQKPNRDISNPVYMLRIRRMAVFIYQAHFTPEFLRDVKVGN